MEMEKNVCRCVAYGSRGTKKTSRDIDPWSKTAIAQNLVLLRLNNH